MSAPTPLTMDDRAGGDDVTEYLSEWSRLPQPLEAALCREANDPDPTVRRAAEVLHRRPPGEEASTRTVWVLAHLLGPERGERARLGSWCWYATRGAAEAAATSSGPTLLHEVGVPRTVRCEAVEDYLRRFYRAAPSSE